MRNDSLREALLRKARYETLEERLVLSAQPLGDFFLSETLLSGTIVDYGELAPALNTVHQGSGVAHAQKSYGLSGRGQTVAVIDSGVAYDHVALGGGLGAGYRVVGGWDFTEENDANPYDDGPAGFHGTHVAGIIGSNDAAHLGVAPEVDLVALRVFNDQGAGYFEWVENALRWVHDNRHTFENPITTVNLSLGTSWNADSVPKWATLEDEFALLESDGIFISVAAGNSFSKYNATGLNYPAVSPYVVPVASSGSDGQLSDFSQRHDRVLVAPGEKITSTVPDYLFGADGNPNDFAAASGTSMASPYVAGASVLVREAMQFAGHQNITQDAIYDHLRSTADLVYDNATGAYYHRLNLQRAIDTLLPDDFGSTESTALDLGVLQGGESVSGSISRLDDRDFFTFVAGQSGTVRFTVSSSDELAADWEKSGGGQVGGAALSFDVVAGESYTVSLGTADRIGHYEIHIALDKAASGDAGSGDSQSDPLAELAYNTDQDLGLYTTGIYGENWAGWGEKWMKSQNGTWHFITPDGSFYRWGGSRNLANSTLVAKFDASFHADPSKLHDAPPPESAKESSAEKDSHADSGGSHGTSDPLAELAYQTDQQLGLRFTGSYGENWAGWGEKWMKSQNGKWHFITPDGSFYRWGGSKNLANSTLIASFDATYHADPSKLHDAPPPAAKQAISANSPSVWSSQFDDSASVAPRSSSASHRGAANEASTIDTPLLAAFAPGRSHSAQAGNRGSQFIATADHRPSGTATPTVNNGETTVAITADDPHIGVATSRNGDNDSGDQFDDINDAHREDANSAEARLDGAFDRTRRESDDVFAVDAVFTRLGRRL